MSQELPASGTFRLEGKTIVVTGGSLGIGYACAEEVLAAGGRALICARTASDVEQAREKLSANGQGDAVRGMTADVTRRDDVARLFEAADAWGGLAGVIHSAGVYGPIGPVTTVDPDEWFDAVRINLFGTFLVAREACTRLAARGGGSVVLMSGGGAATPFPNYTAYASSKVAVVRLTETLAIEVADTGVRVNCLAPGFVATRLHEQTIAAGEKLAGTFVDATKAQLAKGGVPPTVAARASAFLLSDAAKGITGRFVAAPYDGWSKWPERVEGIADSDLFTLRRIVPRDRGQDWQ